MRVHRFFIKEIVSKDTLKITDGDVIHQMRDVFRLKKGDRVNLLDNTGFEYEADVELMTRDEASFKILNKKENTFVPKKNIHLACALTKKTFEWILEKGTELGVTEFTPIISERSEKKNVNHERGLKIITESAEQSGKTTLPKLNPETSLEEVLERGHENMFALHLVGEPFSADVLNSKNNLTILIGPEGGWSDKELALFSKKNIPHYSLGPQVLRAETAAISVAVLLLI